ncbi:MAG: succinate dehydrogenase cytochrome b subunit [Myxococcota bacterium]
MQRALTLTKTTIGKKVLMAASGTVILGFAVGHLAGNLKIFAGAQEFNEYAAFLRSLPALLWGTRIALLVAFSVHIASAFSLWQRNRHARKSRYARKASLASDYASRTMYWTGPILAFYVLFHLLHLTLGGVIFPDNQVLFIEGYVFDPHNPFNNMVYGFQHPLVVVPYVLGVVALGMHLFHGIWSLFQSLGANHPRYNDLRRDLSVGLSALITVGFLIIPIAVLAGLVEPTTETFHFPELEP